MSSVVTSIDLKELICNLIGYLKKNKSMDCLKKIDSYYRFFTINKNSGFSRNFRVSSLAEYIQAHLTKPFSDIYSSTFLRSTNLESHLLDICILQNNEIRGEFEEIYYDYEGRLNDEQSTVRNFLYSLRKCVLYTQEEDYLVADRQKLYTILRNALCFKLDAYYTPIVDDINLRPLGANIWSERELDRLVANLEMEFGYHDSFVEAIDLFKNCFKPVVSRNNSIKICGVCGLPLKLNNGTYYCVSDNTCKKHPYFNFEKYVDYKLDSYTKYFSVKEGVQYFVTRTGIVEYFTYLDFKKAFEKYRIDVIQYPKLDAEGDIKLTLDVISVLVDLKDWISYEALAKSIEKEPHKYKTKDILYIPSYRYNSYATSISARDKISLALRSKCSTNDVAPVLASGLDTNISFVNAVIKKFAEKGVILSEEV